MLFFIGVVIKSTDGNVTEKKLEIERVVSDRSDFPKKNNIEYFVNKKIKNNFLKIRKPL